MYFILLAVILITIIPWLVGFIFANEFQIKLKKLPSYKKILVIFPHPDDEVINAGGLMKKFSQQGIQVTLAILTKGEKGTEDGHQENNLKQIRTEEAKKATKLLGVSTLIHEDFGDGELVKHKEDLTHYIDKLIQKTGLDLIITYDLSGLYGHEDHIVLSEIVTRLVKHKYKNIHVWYPSLPKRIFSMIQLPEHMAKDPDYKRKREYPTFRVFVGLGVINKIHAVYGYKSQIQSFRNSFPIKWIPLWYYYSMQLFEYYAEAK